LPARGAPPDADAEINPTPVDGGGHKQEGELDRLRNILKAFNEQFVTLFTAVDAAYQNAKQNTPAAAGIEHDKALAKVTLAQRRYPGFQAVRRK